MHHLRSARHERRIGCGPVLHRVLPDRGRADERRRVSHSVITRSNGPGTSSIRLERCRLMSMPRSFMTAIEWLLTPAGRVPALCVSTRPRPRWLARPSASWLRAEFPVQTNRMRNGLAFRSRGVAFFMRPHCSPGASAASAPPGRAGAACAGRRGTAGWSA
jgi:hypothetical protein